MLNISEQRKKEYEELAIENFRTYLKIPSVHPDVDYDGCVSFLQAQAASMDLPSHVVIVHPKKPVVIITWKGTEPSLSSIVLNSHTDVVPVFEDHWTHKPFSAYIDDEGRIFARGSQDMKSVGIQHLEAIRRLKENGFRLKRTVHCTFVPDEEIGGVLGMRKFVLTDEFKNLNVGFAMDESLATESDRYVVFYGEKCMWNIRFHCPGEPGHGSQLMENTASQKLRKLLDRIDDFRNAQITALKNDPTKTKNDVIIINATIVMGGVQFNVLPAEICVGMDCRMPVTTNLVEWEATLKQWCKESGEDVWFEKVYSESITKPTILDENNPFWVAFKRVAADKGYKLDPVICPAITDARYLRGQGIPAIGFSPMIRTPRLIHANNEFLHKDVFLEGIDVFCNLIHAVANV